MLFTFFEKYEINEGVIIEEKDEIIKVFFSTATGGEFFIGQ